MIKYGIHSYKNWAMAIATKKISYENVMKFGIPEIILDNHLNNDDTLNVRMHLPDVQVGINQVVPQLAHISRVVSELIQTRNELISSVSNFFKVDNVLPIAMECSVLKEINVSYPL